MQPMYTRSAPVTSRATGFKVQTILITDSVDACNFASSQHHAAYLQSAWRSEAANWIASWKNALSSFKLVDVTSSRNAETAIKVQIGSYN